jgi:hypothetical protein
MEQGTHQPRAHLVLGAAKALCNFCLLLLLHLLPFSLL